MQSLLSGKKIKPRLLEGDINFQKCDLWITKTPVRLLVPAMHAVSHGYLKRSDHHRMDLQCPFH